MESKELLNVLHKYFEESIFITDGQGKILFANELSAQRLGTTTDELEGRNVRDLLADGLYEHSTVLEAIRTKKPVVGSIGGSFDNGTYSNSVPVLGEDGEVEYTLTTNMSAERNLEWEKIISMDRQENARIRRNMEHLRQKYQQRIIARSPQMRKVLAMIDAVAPSDSSVVILGESGTGKDVIAQILHERSGRRTESYISINCAAMPESLLESELFGYESGAFTGAKSDGKIGLFEAAAGGTLFLDEIGEMSLSLQSKLLRVLENREIRRIGGLENIPVDVRIICATNNDLEKMVKEKKFREDLYYRISVFTINLPPLKDRKEDIIPIAEMFLQELNARYGTHKVLSEVTIDTMMNYYWPGNIRELRNVIERIYVVSPGNELIFTPIPTAEYGNLDTDTGTPRLIIKEFSGLKDFMNYAEDEYIKMIMKECGGSVNKTAERLGIHRSVLYRKLHKEK